MLINLSVNILGKKYPLDTKKIHLKGVLNDQNVEEVFILLQQLTSLTQLWCSNNQLTSLPETLGQLTSLTKLSCSENKLTSLPNSIGQLTSLTYLDCFSNKLTSLPETLGQLTSLTTLYCFSNKLTSLPNSIGQLTSLTHLDCSWNKLTSLPQSIGQLTSLTRLDCSGNKLTSLPVSINDIPNLTDLRTDPNVIRPKKVLKIPDEQIPIKEYFCQICLSDSPEECESVGVLLPCHHTICLDGMQEWFDKNRSLKCNYCQTLYGPSQCKHIILST